MRFFAWRTFATKNFWQRKSRISLEELKHLARLSGVGLPFFTIMVPARNESQVIGRTIENLMQLDYQHAFCEIAIVTDEKERQEHEKNRPHLVDELYGFLSKGAEGDPMSIQVVQFFLAYIITNLPLGELLFRLANIDSKINREAMATRMRRLVFSMCTDILADRPTDLSAVYYGLRRVLPRSQDEEFSQAVKEILVLVRLALSKLGERFHKYLHLTKRVDIIAQMTGGLPHTSAEMQRLTDLDKILYESGSPSKAELTDLFDSFFLTTQEVVESYIKSWEDKGFRLKHIEVPYDFDGSFGGECIGEPVKSTKGRALNFAFSKVDPQTQMIVFYDAESHPDRDVLLHTAKLLLSKDPPEILQGPLFQVRNYYRMGALSRIGGLYKAIAHDWYLPLLLKKLPFVGGTNLFISWRLIKKMHGFDENTLTEDLEFGCRAYLYFGAKLTFLPVKSTEQTPPTVAQYFRQRLRWGSGHLEVMRRLPKYPFRQDAVGDAKDFKHREKQLWWNLLILGPFEWLLYQLSTIVVLIMDIILIANAFGAGIPGPFFAENRILYFMLLGLNIPYFGFTFYCYLRYDEVFDKSFRPISLLLGVMDFAKLFIASFVVFLLPAPYTWAVVLAAIGRSPKVWVKTPRTSE